MGTKFNVDANGNQTMDGTLQDGSGLTSIDINTRKLYDTTGTHVQIDFSTPNVIDLSPLSAPSANKLKINKISVYTAFQSPAGIVNFSGFSSINATSTDALTSDMVFITPRTAPNGTLSAYVSSPGTVSISSTASETCDVCFWVVSTH